MSRNKNRERKKPPAEPDSGRTAMSPDQAGRKETNGGERRGGGERWREEREQAYHVLLFP